MSLSKKEIMDLEDSLPTISESYTRISKIEKYQLEQLYRKAIKFLKADKFQLNCVLDVGCGDGFILNWIDEQFFQNCNYIGVDFSRKKIEHAKSLYHHLKIEFIKADANNLPFQSDSFGKVLMLEAIEHFPNPQNIILELKRVLCKRGKLIITTPSAFGVKGTRIEILKRLLNPRKRQLPSSREKSLNVCGLDLPHRDFTEDEVISLMQSHFELRTLKTFQFSILYWAISTVPNINWFLIRMDNAIEKLHFLLPKIWGSKFLVVGEKIGCKI